MTEEKISNKKRIKLHYEQMPLWKLAFKLAEKEGELINIIKMGDNNKQSLRKINRIRYKRNIVREVMLDKLKKWKHKELYDDLTYAEMVERFQVK